LWLYAQAYLVCPDFRPNLKIDWSGKGRILMSEAETETVTEKKPSMEDLQNRMSEQIIENEFRLSVLELLMEIVVSRNPGVLTNEDIKASQEKALNNLQKKYPGSGIQLTGGAKVST
jgi:hypothetical protein